MVSILIPVYDVKQYLSECIESVVNQTYADLQVVLFDDGSTDGSWDVCKTYAEKDGRVEAYHKENSGVADTRNCLLEKVKGEYVLFVDSDDWIEPDMVENLLNISRRYDADIVNCKNVINDELCDKSEKSINILNQQEAIALFLEHRELRGSLCNKLVKTSSFHNVKFHCGISLGEDALFCWEILQYAKCDVMTKQEYYHYRMVDNSITHSSFGPKNFSSYIVWSRICDDTDKYWPKYANVAKARYCIQMTLMLRNAAMSDYEMDDSVKKLQDIIREYGHLITKTKLSSWKMRLCGLIGCRSYKLLKLLRYV
jgi:glycosyltransferase involved in cell wall biosynthesis